MTFRPFKWIEWLLAIEGEDESAVRSLLVRTMVDDAPLSILILLWTQGACLIIYLMTGWAWLGLVSIVDALIFLQKHRLRQRLAPTTTSYDRLPILGILTTNFVFTILLAIEIAALFSIPSQKTFVVALVMAVGYNGYVSVLYAPFPRLAMLYLTWSGIALTAGIATSFMPSVHVMAPIGPFLAVCFLALIRRSRSSLIDSVRAQHLHFLQSRHDPLTGLPNRALMTERLSEHWANSATGENRDAVLGVLCMDLDDFKGVNDRYGHAAGDMVLVHVANRLLAAVRCHDMVVRLGGDEYVVILPDADPVTLETIADRITAAVAEPMTIAAGTSVRIGISVGSATLDQRDVAPEELLARADLALYEAKRQRRDSYRSAS